MTVTQPEGLDMTTLPNMPLNVAYVTRRIRRCDGDAAAQVVLEHFAMEYARAALAAAPAQSAKTDMPPPLKDSQRSHATSFYMSLPHNMDSAEAVITKVAADAYVNGFQAGKHCASPQPSPTAVVLDERAAKLTTEIKELVREKPTAVNAYGLKSWAKIEQKIAEALAGAQPVAQSVETAGSLDVSVLARLSAQIFDCPLNPTISKFARAVEAHVHVAQPVEQTAVVLDDDRAAPLPIQHLIAEFEADGFNFSDLDSVKKIALRYVETMPDSQVRALLYTLALAQPVEQTRALTGDAVANAVFLLRKLADQQEAGGFPLTAGSTRHTAKELEAAARPASGETET